MPTATLRWSDLLRPWLLDPRRFQLLRWVGLPALCIAALAVPIPLLAVSAVALLALWFWRDPLAVVLLLVVFMGNDKVHYWTGYITIFPELPVLALATAVWMLQWLGDTRGAGERRLFVPFVVFVFAGALSFVNAIDVVRVYTKLLMIVFTLLMFALTLRGVRGRRDLRRVIVWIQVSAAVVSAYGVAQVLGGLLGFDPSLHLIEKFQNPEFLSTIGAPLIWRLTKIFRVNAFFNDPNLLAGYIAAVVPLVLALRLHNGRTGRRGLAFTQTMLLLLLGVCFLLTLSRSGMLALAVGVSVVLLFMPEVMRRPAFWLATALLVSAAGASSVLVGYDPLVLFARLLQTSDFADMSNRLHLDVAGYAVTLFLRFPFTGAGLRNYGFYYSSELDPYYPQMIAHNTFLSYFAETGLVGGLAFVTLTVGILLRPWRALRDRRLRGEDPELFAWLVGLLGAVAAINAANLFYEFYLRTFPWVFSALAVAAARLWSDRSTAARTP